MNEAIPIVGGIVLGLVLSLVHRTGWRLAAGIIGAPAVAVAATVVTGEYRIGWEYLVLDVPLSVLSATASYLAVGRRRAPGVTVVPRERP